MNILYLEFSMLIVYNEEMINGLEVLKKNHAKKIVYYLLNQNFAETHKMCC